MQYKIIENGLFKVFPDGVVYQLKRGVYVLPRFNYVSRNRKYVAISINVDGKSKMFYVHRLVATAFIPNPYNKPEVNHIDGNPGNNNVTNLEWVTRSENTNHAYRTGLVKGRIKRVHKCSECGTTIYSCNVLCQKCYDRAKWRRLYKKVTNRNIVQAIEYLNSESPELTDHQKCVLNMVSQGMRYREVGSKLGISKQAVGVIVINAAKKQADLKEAYVNGLCTR